ncbi:hypothetical protein KAI92_03085 [Candidatus Parcubacteria bacterium]|nr:hypothetical protein [Candidatus Parcubacteria bacterium]
MKINFKKLTRASVLLVSLFIIAFTSPTIAESNNDNKINKQVAKINKVEIQDPLINGYIAKATDWLKLTKERASNGNIDAHVGYIRKYAEKASITMEDIGTSEEEIASLLKIGYTAEASNWLKLTKERASNGNIDSHVGYIRKYVEKANITIEDIGTSEEKIASLLKTGYTAYARMWLKLIQENANQYSIEFKINYLRQYAELAGVTIEQLGITEQELRDSIEYWN